MRKKISRVWGKIRKIDQKFWGKRRKVELLPTRHPYPGLWGWLRPDTALIWIQVPWIPGWSSKCRTKTLMEGIIDCPTSAYIVGPTKWAWWGHQLCVMGQVSNVQAYTHASDQRKREKMWFFWLIMNECELQESWLGQGFYPGLQGRYSILSCGGDTAVHPGAGGLLKYDLGRPRDVPLRLEK